MKNFELVLFIGLAAVMLHAVSGDETEPEPVVTRAKRFVSLNSGFYPFGGHTGCVVTENAPGNMSLYLNSHFDKYLNEDEIKELKEYKENLTKFKEEVKQYFEKQERELKAVRGSEFREKQSRETAVPSITKRPESPSKPSFCLGKSAVQHIFPGCNVQGNKLYIGNSFARTLTPKEEEELELFSKKIEEYQNAIAKSIKQQVEDIFGKNLVPFFKRNNAIASSTSPPSAEDSSNDITTLEEPKVPDLCVFI